MAADSTGLIGKVLEDLNLHLFHDRFRAEKITTDIVCKLSAHEFQTLGISNTRDMIRLRNECVKYGTEKPKKVWPQCGPPMYDIPKTVLEMFLENGCTITYISNLLSVSERTIYRRMAQYGLSKMNFSEISDDDLDLKLGEILKDFPLCGENLLRQMITLKGIRVPRWRLRESIHRMDERGVCERQAGRLHRRVYNVTGPNHLWHIDTNHKLVRWRFIIVGGIDGFSRLVMFLRCTDNNTADTYCHVFCQAWNNMVYQIGLDQIKVWKIYLWLTTCCPKKVMGVCLLEKAHTISALRDFGETCTMGFLYIFITYFIIWRTLVSLTPSTHYI